MFTSDASPKRGCSEPRRKNTGSTPSCEEGVGIMDGDKGLSSPSVGETATLKALFLTLHNTNRETIDQRLGFVASQSEAGLDGAKGKLSNTLQRVSGKGRKRDTWH